MSEEEARKFFKYDHLPAHLQVISKPFGDLAFFMLDLLPDNSQRWSMLQKLVEAKDCAVRSKL